MNKTYKTIDEQIDYLKHNKKIIVSNEDRHILEERNYSSLINPYKEFFSYGRDNDGNHIYKDEIDFRQILELIKIDEEFSTTMYSYIGAFEKKFKSILFSEICKKYAKDDKYCISYVDEISEFLITHDENKLPRFCPNFRYTLSKKGYVEDSFGITKKTNLLLRIKELGEGKKAETSNKLILHYVSTQKIAPLWTISSALTLGEFNILFSMLDNESQKKIVSNFYKKTNYTKIPISKLASFSGILEVIRKIRNIVNHYEPIFPFLVSEMKPINKIENSQLYSAIEFLERIYNEDLLRNISVNNYNISQSNFNSKYIKILKVMENFKIKSEPLDSLV